MLVRIVSADTAKAKVQICLLKDYFQKKGWEVFIGGGLKDFPDFAQDKMSTALVLYAGYNEQVIEAKEQLKEGRAVITGKWDELPHAYSYEFPFESRLAFGYIKDSLQSPTPTISFLLKVKTDGLADIMPGLTAEQYQKALLDLAGRKTEKGWQIMDGECGEEAVKKCIKNCLSGWSGFKIKDD
ncbi:MAG: hypothetical protein ABH919_02675 [bacterium]